MTTLHEAAQQALAAWNTGDLRVLGPAMGALRAALKQEEEAAAWLAERKEHWRKEREKAQEAKDQDPELSAALGWPGGISNPVLDRTQLLQMVAALRVSAQQARQALEGWDNYGKWVWPESALEQAKRNTTEALATLRAALAQEWAEPLTIERLRDALVASRIIPPEAVEDPDEYDDGVTLFRIGALHRRIT